ncbi:MAG: methyl-accepting chemotaxis protein [Leptospiraceae bacterium]|nr:methyl-accepting chemotaxis protein [Leptospiraceae bacterium]
MPLLLITALNTLAGIKWQQSSILEHIYNIARIKHDVLNNFYDNSIDKARLLAEEPALQRLAETGKAGREEAASILAEFQEKHWGDYHHIMLVNARGIVVVSPPHKSPTNHHGGQDLSASPFFQKARQSVQITDFYGFEEKDHYHQLLLFPVKTYAGQKEANLVLVFEIEIGRIEEILQKNFKLGDSGRAYLAALDGRPVLRLKSEQAPHVDREQIQNALTMGSSTGQYRNTAGDLVFGIYLHDKRPWIMIIEIDAKEIYGPIWSTLALELLVTLLVIVVIAFVARWSSRRYNRPILAMLTRMQELSQGKGNLSIRIAVDPKGDPSEMLQLAEALNSFLDYTTRIIEQMQDSLQQSSENSATLLTESNTMAEMTQSVSAAVEESSAALEQLEATVDSINGHMQSNSEAMQRNQAAISASHNDLSQINANALELSQITSESSALARDSEQAVAGVNEAMLSVQQISTEIQEMLVMINDISSRTNLLALNASIEAARAGEEGRGFAVVAHEISNLADSTQNSVNSISALLAKTSQDVNDGVARVDQATTFLNQMAARIHRIDQLTGCIAESVSLQSSRSNQMDTDFKGIYQSFHEIKAMTQEELKSMQEIGRSVQSIANLTEGSVEQTHRLHAISDRLKAIAAELQKLIGSFKIR